MSGYRVLAPLVVAADPEGRNHHYRDGAVIRWLNDRQRAHFLRRGLVQEVGETQPASTDADTAPESPASKPAKTAPVERWADYGASLGHERDELLALGKQNKQELIDLLSG